MPGDCRVQALVPMQCRPIMYYRPQAPDGGTFIKVHHQDSICFCGVTTNALRSRSGIGWPGYATAADCNHVL